MRVLLGCCLLLSSALSGWSAESLADTDGRALDLLIDFHDRYSKFDKMPRAFVASGYKTTIRNDELIDTPAMFVGAQEKSGHRLDCWCTTFTAKYVTESWKQRLSDNRGTRFRLSDPRMDSPRTLNEEDIDEANGLIPKPIYPSLQTLCMSYLFWTDGTNKRIVERILEGEITHSEYLENGDLLADWKLPGRTSMSIVIVFSSKEGFNPTDVKWYSLKTDKRRLLSHAKSTWERKGEHWVVSKIESASLQGRGEDLCSLDFEWKLGKELAEKKIVDATQQDWREPIRLLFEYDWQRRGRRPVLATSPIDEDGDDAKKN
ncbi:MAG: hypothetical protein WBD31_04240 [Rubripirellula sp.]